MASNDPVLQVIRASPPTTLYATRDRRVGGSTPAESPGVFDFDASVIEYMDFECRLAENYAGGGLTFQLPWRASIATGGVARLGVAVRRHDDDADDIDASHTYVFTDVDDTAASGSGEFSYPTIDLASGSAMDGWLAGEMAIVRVRRNATHANDTMTGDLELSWISAKET